MYMRQRWQPRVTMTPDSSSANTLAFVVSQALPHELASSFKSSDSSPWKLMMEWEEEWEELDDAQDQAGRQALNEGEGGDGRFRDSACREVRLELVQPELFLLRLRKCERFKASFTFSTVHTLDSSTAAEMSSVFEEKTVPLRRPSPSFVKVLPQSNFSESSSLVASPEAR